MNIKRWEEYRDFFQITIFRYLVLWFSLVPIIAGVIYQLPSPLMFSNGEEIFEIELSLPFSWQFLWLSSLFFVVALSIYKYRCPEFIKKYNTFSDYQAYSHDQRWVAWEASFLIKGADKAQMDKLFNRLSVKKFLIDIDEKDFPGHGEVRVKESQTICYFTHEEKKYGLGMPVLKHDLESSVIEKGVFYELFGRYSESYVNSRNTIRILLLISFSLFLVVLMQHIYEGGALFIGWVMEFLVNRGIL